MLLILSARPVGEDIAHCYGKLPPSFLPLGSDRLFTRQAALGRGEPVAMTVPEGFEVASTDRAEIERLGIRLLPQDPSLSLTDALRDAVGRAAPDGPLRLVYGDTLIRLDEEPEGDFVAVQETSANYDWAYVTPEAFSDTPPDDFLHRRVVCGYYRFDDPALLARSCEAGGIVEALNAYDRERPMARVEVPDWYDLGHLSMYYQSKKSMMVKRSFNDVSVEEHSLVKRSADTPKMRAEAHWYETLPTALQVNAPRYLGRVERDHMAGYAIEYLYQPLVSELAVFGALPLTSWLEILSACLDFVDECRTIRPAEQSPEASPGFASAFFDQMIVGKTRDRLDAYLADSELSEADELTINGARLPPIGRVAEALIAAVPATTPGHVRFWHGDLFFGNLFYDFTARRIMAIDPRGLMPDGMLCAYGDWRYDVAKLSHSVIGRYDQIILGRASLERSSAREWTLSLPSWPHGERLAEVFLAQASERYGLDRDELTALTALMFLSMLPLHADQPALQRQMLANGLRLATHVEGIAR